MAESLFALALLACPVGMGVMMWMMSRGHNRPPHDADTAEKRAELAELQAEIRRLQARPDDRRGGSAARPSS